MYMLEQIKRQFDIFVLFKTRKKKEERRKFKAGVTEALSTLGKIFPDLSLRKMAE